MLDVPESARAGGYADEEPSEGWLFDRLTGRKRDDSAADSSLAEEARASKVVPTSAIVPGSSSPASAASTAGAEAAASAFKPKEDDGYELEDFYPSNIVGTVKEMAGYGPDEDAAGALYQEAKALYQERKFAEAAERFRAASKRAPESPLQEDSLFWWGESLFFSDQYPKANEAYAELLEKYDFTRHMDTVVARQFAIGRYWEQLNAADPAWLAGFQWSDSSRPKFDTWGNAIKAYRSVRLNDPTGPLADDAVMATANAYFLKGRFEDASHHYDLIRTEYPKSEHSLNSHLLGMKSKLSVYQGPMYDGEPLEEAAKIADRALIQFGSELGSERDRVVQTKNKILEDRAERYWTRAQYYEKLKRYGAARVYYQSILDEYPTTPAAQRARQRLTEIYDFPDKPPNRFQWLTDRFPSSGG